MRYLFKKTHKDIVIQVSDKQTIHICKKIPKFINWSKNRPPDTTRINQLKEYYVSEKISFIPGIIYAWDNGDTLQIYDGIHRILAANDLDCEFTFLMCVYKTKDEDLIVNDFKAINKSCPVPTLYTDEQTELTILKKLVCENIVEELCKKYYAFVSPSRKPYIYNFNRDVIIEWLSEFNIDWNIKNLSAIIFQELQGLNFVAKDYVERNKINPPKKCHFHNFYLWYLTKPFIQNKIEQYIKGLS
jgi:hypothetical protein